MTPTSPTLRTQILGLLLCARAWMGCSFSTTGRWTATRSPRDRGRERCGGRSQRGFRRGLAQRSARLSTLGGIRSRRCDFSHSPLDFPWIFRAHVRWEKWRQIMAGRCASYEWGVNNSPEGKDLGFTHCFTLGFEDEGASQSGSRFKWDGRILGIGQGLLNPLRFI